MSYVLLIKEQLEVFFDSLRKLISGKHEILAEPFPPNVNFEFGDNVQVEVVKLKLDSSPNFKTSEYCFQCKLIQVEKDVEIHSFCYKNYELPDSSASPRWGKFAVKLATLSKAAEKLSRGLEQRTIKIGLSREYVRKIGTFAGKTYFCSFVKAGNGFNQNHWHDHDDIEEIIKARLSTQKMVKIAGNGEGVDNRICCGKKNAYVEVLKDNTWIQEENKNVVDVVEDIHLNQ